MPLPSPTKKWDSKRNQNEENEKTHQSSRSTINDCPNIDNQHQQVRVSNISETGPKRIKSQRTLGQKLLNSIHATRKGQDQTVNYSRNIANAKVKQFLVNTSKVAVNQSEGGHLAKTGTENNLSDFKALNSISLSSKYTPQQSQIPEEEFGQIDLDEVDEMVVGNVQPTTHDFLGNMPKTRSMMDNKFEGGQLYPMYQTQPLTLREPTSPNSILKGNGQINLI